MKKKNDPPRPSTPLPAMFVGDEEPPPQPPPISAQALVAGAPAAAMLPEDLRVTTEGTSGSRVPLIVLALLAVLFGALAVVKAQELSVFSLLMAASYAICAATCTLLAWRGLRDLIWSREEYRLDEDGIALNVLRGTERPRVSRIRWTDIVDYTVSLDDETLHLRVESGRGAVFSLRDSPPRLSTREFIRRFILEAERHPRAARREDSLVNRIAEIGFAVLFIGGAIAEATLDLSERQQNIAFNAVIVIAFGLYLWHTVDDSDVARSDRTSKHLIARLRRWLRRVLNIPVT